MDKELLRDLGMSEYSIALIENSEGPAEPPTYTAALDRRHQHIMGQGNYYRIPYEMDEDFQEGIDQWA